MLTTNLNNQARKFQDQMQLLALQSGNSVIVKEGNAIKEERKEKKQKNKYFKVAKRGVGITRKNKSSNKKKIKQEKKSREVNFKHSNKVTRKTGSNKRV